MGFLKEILKGVLIGIANVIPGISGGTMAVSMGIYDKIINAISNIRKDFRNSFRTLLPYGIGLILGIIVLTFFVSYLFEKFPIPTCTAFIGLILGGLKPIIKKVDGEKFKITHLISFFIFALIIILPSVLMISERTVTNVEFGFASVTIMLGLGVISAGAMVVPGVSGSMILMMLGYYTYVLNSVKLIITSILKLDFETLFSRVIIILPFTLGVILGTFLISKFVSFLLKKYPLATYWGIIALVVVSPFPIIMQLDLASVSIVTVLVSIITFFLGAKAASLISKM